mmetsp:Transcript_11243/g.30031  ORF Transcript_11243/g.30031 Transcript_11243/m.30031 type:complete len:236 (-) Transcript_11243:489-1196(-)
MRRPHGHRAHVTSHIKRGRRRGTPSQCRTLRRQQSGALTVVIRRRHHGRLRGRCAVAQARVMSVAVACHCGGGRQANGAMGVQRVPLGAKRLQVSRHHQSCGTGRGRSRSACAIQCGRWARHGWRRCIAAGGTGYRRAASCLSAIGKLQPVVGPQEIATDHVLRGVRVGLHGRSAFANPREQRTLLGFRLACNSVASVRLGEAFPLGISSVCPGRRRTRIVQLSSFGRTVGRQEL